MPNIHVRPATEALLLDKNDLTGTADAICSNKPADTVGFFSSDCGVEDGKVQPEFSCDCCHSCCHDEDPECNNNDWTPNLDPIWEYSYTRQRFFFDVDFPDP